MLSAQQVHDHMPKNVSIPERWRSKNYAFEFANTINENPALWHTLTVDESPDMYSDPNASPVKLLQLHDILQAIPQFFQAWTGLAENGDADLGCHLSNARKAQWCCSFIKDSTTLMEQHCLAHREDLGIDNAWKDVPLMRV